MFILSLIIFTLFVNCLSLPTEELQDIINEAEMMIDNEKFSDLKQIVPSGMPTFKSIKPMSISLTSLINEDNEVFFKSFMEQVNKGYAKKGLTFSVYDSDMREVAISLFRLIQELDKDAINKTLEWANQHINKDIVEYALRLASVFSNKVDYQDIPPPFITNPKYFVNGEVLKKAADLYIRQGVFDSDEKIINQFDRVGDVITLNANYSGWNSFDQPCEDELDYFREDIALNSYYYSLNLLHPFWMSNTELDDYHPRHAEHYYFAHQQLMARYLLEKESMPRQSPSCQKMYDPYLMYDNGLKFPTRSSNKMVLKDEQTRLATIDIALKECISRGIIMMQNGTMLNLTEENHEHILSKLIRANLDGVKTAKLVRTLFGYGGSVPSCDEYNPSPSVLHHPQTSLRDPIFWELIQHLLDYFIDYKKTLKPYDLSRYETTEFKITNFNVPNIKTYFTEYEFDISETITNKVNENFNEKLSFFARQRRLNHHPFSFNIDVLSLIEGKVMVNFFLGPKCANNCWDLFHRFYKLGYLVQELKRGKNTLTWSTNKASHSDEYSVKMANSINDDGGYNMFKFPKSILIPRGLENGLNLTLFVIIFPIDEAYNSEIVLDENLHQSVIMKFDDFSLGFPFHRPATKFNPEAFNYKFYNITINHQINPFKGNNYFSHNLL